ncbi:MAG: histidinol dehydrogenase [Syntrophales bacterium]|nr:histidinol dehydrogenase [Syntrophales bacterium]MCK9392616.1 histidinol dehydrogenase [Syntrophales bacterium]
MRVIRTDEAIFEEVFQGIMNRGGGGDPALRTIVENILQDVAARGDAALFEYTAKFDSYVLNPQTVQASPEEIREAAALVDPDDRAVLQLAAARIEKFHRSQILKDWRDESEDGVRIGQRITPLERVGIYVPGGLASYPSTVLMAAIPARIAGVKEIIAVTPLREGTINPLVALAMELGGVNRIFKIGGAQAIAALTYGTASIPRVDKIVGPGNAYVATAKQLVYGHVDIDMIAGPSEVLIICDGTAPVSFVAADLLAQAEHDDMASAVVLTTDEATARLIVAELYRQLENLPRKAIVRRAIDRYGAVLVTKDLAEAVQLANRFAPEHLELMVENPEALLSEITHAGAVFLGQYTPEALGDYMAGPNHILPTGGTARFSSPLGVYDFVKRTSVLSFTREAFHRYGRQTERFAALEGLDAHGKSISVRLDQ